MPNRGEIAVPALRSRNSAAGARDAWAVVCFCAIGLTMSIYVAAHALHLGQVHALIAAAALG